MLSAVIVRASAPTAATLRSASSTPTSTASGPISRSQPTTNATQIAKNAITPTTTTRSAMTASSVRTDSVRPSSTHERTLTRSLTRSRSCLTRRLTCRRYAVGHARGDRRAELVGERDCHDALLDRGAVPAVAPGSSTRRPSAVPRPMHRAARHRRRGWRSRRRRSGARAPRIAPLRCPRVSSPGGGLGTAAASNQHDVEAEQSGGPRRHMFDELVDGGAVRDAVARPRWSRRDSSEPSSPADCRRQTTTTS